MHKSWMRRIGYGVAGAVASCLLLTGCNLDPRTATLPGGVATGDDGYTVTASFPDAANLVPNAEVQYQNVRIGTVRSISLDQRTWRASVKISLLKSVPLPANVRLTVGQKSLLGAQFVEIDAPAQPVGRLTDGAVIPPSATGDYPQTEDVLAAAAALLNNGGLAEIKNITTELNNALHNRTDVSRDLLARLNEFAVRLDEQKGQLLDAIDSMNTLARELAAGRDTVARALVHITPAITTLNHDQRRIVTTLQAMNRLGVVATSALNADRGGLATNLRLLRPTLTRLAEAGDSVPKSLPLLLTFPFDIDIIPKAIRGDYMNLFETFDFSLASVRRDYLGSVPIIQQLPLITDAKNPFTAPLQRGGRPANPTGPAKRGKAGGPLPQSPLPGTSPSAPQPTPTPSCDVIGQLLGSC